MSGEDIVVEVTGGLEENPLDVDSDGSLFRENVTRLDFGPDFPLTDLGGGNVEVGNRVASRAAKLSMSSNQSISSGSKTTLSFDNAIFDSVGVHDGSQGFTLDRDGYWYIDVMVRMLDTNSGNGTLKLYLDTGTNATNIVQERQRAITEPLTSHISGMIDADSGDGITSAVEQDTGNTQAIDSDDRFTWLEVFYLGE